MVNRVTLIGSLGSDPEIKYTQSGTAVVNISLATVRRLHGVNDFDEVWTV